VEVLHDTCANTNSKQKSDINLSKEQSCGIISAVSPLSVRCTGDVNAGAAAATCIFEFCGGIPVFRFFAAQTERRTEARLYTVRHQVRDTEGENC
jgi:hypothetical protein